jgi:hypothetical protein
VNLDFVGLGCALKGVDGQVEQELNQFRAVDIRKEILRDGQDRQPLTLAARMEP